MKTFANLSLSVAMISTIASGAFAYHLTPTNITTRLRGTLTFYAVDGKIFKCNVKFFLRTRSGVGFDQPIFIRTQRDSGKSCGYIGFQDLPWHVSINNETSGTSGVSFISEYGMCDKNQAFTINDSGVWTLSPGGCASGTMKSTPPVTIVP
jgi:hypothetical protein